MFEIREYRDDSVRGRVYTVLAAGFTSKEDVERQLSQMIIRDWDKIEIAEVISVNIDKEAAGYLLDLLTAHVGGRASLYSEPLGRVRLALNALQYSEGPDVFDRKYLVSLPTPQDYPNLARSDDRIAYDAVRDVKEW